MPKRKRRKIRWGRILVPILVLVLAAGALFVHMGLKAPGGNEDKTVQVSQGESLDQLIDNLKTEGVIKNSLLSKLYAQIHHAQWFAGNYALNTDMDVKSVFEALSNPSNAKTDSVTLTVPEGTWAKEVAASIAKAFNMNEADILAKWNDMDYITELSKDYPFLDPAVLSNPEIKVKLEGYLFPETYFIDKDANIDVITRTLLDQFESFYEAHKAQFDASRMSVEELVTLASIVQFEAGNSQDMKSIAGVFYNRLQDDMMLQSSVTVCYALYDDFNDPKDCETNYELQSPYNTYLVQGLPPGPILNPGAEALDAVLNPEDNDYLFFAADIYNVKSNPGKVYYSKTYEEHQQIMKELNLVIE